MAAARAAGRLLRGSPCVAAARAAARVGWLARPPAAIRPPAARHTAADSSSMRQAAPRLVEVRRPGRVPAAVHREQGQGTAAGVAPQPDGRRSPAAEGAGKHPDACPSPVVAAVAAAWLWRKAAGAPGRAADCRRPVREEPPAPRRQRRPKAFHSRRRNARPPEWASRNSNRTGPRCDLQKQTSLSWFGQESNGMIPCRAAKLNLRPQRIPPYS